jgi:pullulanase
MHRLLCFVLAVLFFKCSIMAQPPVYPIYSGTDLGMHYTPTTSIFKLWSPLAEKAELLLFKKDWGGEAFKTVALTGDASGVWQAELPGNWHHTYYTCRVFINGNWSNDLPDPYAKAVGTNGKRAMILDLKSTNPPGWIADKSPAFSSHNFATDAIIYELHIRDASIHASSGIKNKGGYQGLTETNTKSPSSGLLTGLSHIKELGVTHVHLLPFFDYNSVDEAMPTKKQYNWGYDPLNYNAPEGSYSSNPADAAVRIRELKAMIAAFHKQGLRVVMDVVYNHVADAAKSNFEQLVPGYYFRRKANGSFSDATACGNETASELPMVRKFMVESVKYWMKEYHLDGFRFDLMGVHDITTMNEIAKTLRNEKPDVLLYGEGWTAGASTLTEEKRALKKHAAQLNGVAVFSDDIRDGIKGSVFDEHDRGFASGKAGMEESIKFGVVAATQHPQIDYSKVNYSKASYASAPGQVVSYCECHDNNTLWDKLELSCPNSNRSDRISMHKLALAITLTSQGISFLHAGTEFLRNKKGVENSYNAGDSINAIDWTLKQKNRAMVAYTRQLIRIRKNHPAFRIPSAEHIAQHLKFDEQAAPGTIIYHINGEAVKDDWKKIIVVYNSNQTPAVMNLPPGKWKRALYSNTSGSSLVAPISAEIFYQDNIPAPGGK